MFPDIVVLGDEDVKDDLGDEPVPASATYAVVVVEADHIPRRAWTEISTEDLSARAQCLWWFIDNDANVLAILAKSPMSEEETLRALRELIRAGEIVLAS
jgi:hypothetical protein